MCKVLVEREVLNRMYFVALATDYDGTLAKDGRVNAATIDALKGVRSLGES